MVEPRAFILHKCFATWSDVRERGKRARDEDQARLVATLLANELNDLLTRGPEGPRHEMPPDVCPAVFWFIALCREMRHRSSRTSSLPQPLSVSLSLWEGIYSR
ncbi:GSU2403 family nucleotidyltransferase fold protein [Chromohalobacter beijerinckii]|uniref:GSU2403 family nucleotidyltransferase fold protein n=1 Tax=Chromohalobacter beijerinckii TaxID=86179 RepID=A0ABV8XGZ9_9GAMM